MKNTIILLNFLPSIDSSYEHKGSIFPSTASMLIGTHLKNHGYDVRIIDGAYSENYHDLLKNALTNDVIYVGMTVMTTQIPFALAASRIIKESGYRIPVVWGGPHPTLFPKETLAHPFVDIVVINEGAETSVELARCIAHGGDLSGINGIGYKQTGAAPVFTPARDLDDLGKLPYFDFSLIDVEKYLYPPSGSVYQREFPHCKEKIIVIPILTALGCPYKCQFCFNVILKRKYRLRSAQSIVDEIRKYMDCYHANTFFFLDEDFFINKKRTLEFIDLVEKEGLHFNWRMWCRVDHFKENYITRELLERMSRIGHGSLVMGGESANQRMLDNLSKGITTSQIVNSVQVITGTGITPRYSFMVGLEGENLDEIKNTYRFCLDLLKINPETDIAGPFIFRLYPGSPIYNRIVQNYDIHVPANLEGWVKLLEEEVTFTKIPWTPREFQENSHLISFYSNFAYLRSTDCIHSINDVLVHVIGKCAKLRLRYFFFRLPVEYYVFFWRRRLLRKE